jgi:hypothetical protein
MAIRILPFRQYNEADVINMFALEAAYVNESTTGSGGGDAGVFVTIPAAGGDLNKDPITYATDSYLGKTDYPFVGANQYPSVSLKIRPATSGEALLGITLRQTAKADENGEKLLYYPQKREELMCVLPGQAVPVATRGVFTLASTAYNGSLTVGGGFALSSGVSGTVTGVAATSAARLGMVIGTGSRTSPTSLSDQFAAAGTTGTYAMIALGL